jgi:RNA polymerase sigma-70 factor (ECF subfamily)
MAYLCRYENLTRMSEDRHLVEAVLARRAGAFERLVREHQGLCWDIVYRMVRHAEDARELSQEVFLKVYRYLDRYRYEASLKTWIGRIAYSVALRHLERKQLRYAEAGDDEDGYDLLGNIGDDFDLEAAFADHQAQRELHAAIDALPPVQRTVLGLYHFDELSIGEIAVVTGLAEGTIKSHLYRARLRLRDILESSLGALS